MGTRPANGPQELFIFMLTRNGRVETANYQTSKLPSNLDIPLFVKGEFGDFYRAMFDHQVDKDRMKNVYLEYAWNMGWCDPCAAGPLSVAELRELGVFWQGEVANRGSKGLARDVFVTRLHVRYTADTFPNDFVFRETTDRSNFQGRYILRHPWKGERSQCEAAEQYFSSLPQRFETEAQNLAGLTGWEITTIREKMASNGQSFEEKPAKKVKWYQRLWKK